MITTRQPGAAPEQIETEVSDKIEEAVNTISGLDELRSSTIEGQSQIFAPFGLLLFIQAAANFLWRTDVRSIPTSWAAGNFQLAGLSFSGPELVAGLGALVTAGALYWFVHRTETGLALQAGAEDAQAARLMGIDSDRMYAIAWGVALLGQGTRVTRAVIQLSVSLEVGEHAVGPGLEIADHVVVEGDAVADVYGSRASSDEHSVRHDPLQPRGGRVDLVPFWLAAPSGPTRP